MEQLEAPVYRSILTPPLTFGIPNNLFIFLLVSGLTFIVSLGQIWFAGPVILLLILGKVITAQDIFAIDIILRLIKLPEAMD